MPLYVMYFMHIHSRCIEYTLIFLTNLSMQWILKNNYLEQRVCHSLTYIMIYPRNMWMCLFYTWYVVLLIERERLASPRHLKHLHALAVGFCWAGCTLGLVGTVGAYQTGCVWFKYILIFQGSPSS